MTGFYIKGTLAVNYRSSHRRRSVRKGVLKKLANFTGKHLCWSYLFKMLILLLTKKRNQHKYFSVKFAKFLRTSISKNICERLLLKLVNPSGLTTKISLTENKKTKTNTYISPANTNSKTRNSIQIFYKKTNNFF